ncbi:hypothetical protein AAF712_005458 [Marasmius tenuissimus]|uniref:Carboxylesterase type B domain-containing protein n=1 Tax=Marasmius tenuissimus TaxID=585030 RepID=A0ABR3A0K0_9AGAR
MFRSCTSSQDTLTCLRKTDPSVLESANGKISAAAFYGTFTFVPVVDGTFIRQRATQALREGKVNGNALLAIHSTKEGGLFVNQAASPLDASQYAHKVFPKLTPENTAAVAELYADLASDLTQENLIMAEGLSRLLGCIKRPTQ